MGFAADVQATRSTLTSVDTTLSEAITATQDYIPVASTTNFSTSVVAEIESTNEVVSFTDISSNLITGTISPRDYWGATRSSWGLVGENITAPDGTQTGNFLYENTDTSDHYTTKNAVFAGVNTFSVYLKAGAQNFASLWISSASTPPYGIAYFDLSNGTISSISTGTNVASATITSVGNDWYRCTITTTSLFSNTYYPVIGLGNSQSYTGDGSSGIYIWRPQVEAGTSASPPLPTTATVPLYGLTGVTRGVNGTTAQAASSGDSIQQLPYALGSLDLPIRLKALSVSSDGNGAGRLTLCDNNGDSLCDVDFANDTIYTLTIPEDGIIFPNGIFVSNTDNVEAYTLYTDNFSNPGLTAG